MAPRGVAPTVRIRRAQQAPVPSLEQRERHVANIKSQIKRNRQNERRRLKNKSVRSEMRTRTKTAVSAIDAGAEDTSETIRMAVRRIDRAAAQGVIHKNQASNRKSRLMRRAARAGDQEPVSTKK
ncbi:MAG TPA: 30S ribosomal protein S20 [Acidimicrobiales bacterium]|nr:30S ribosomal protein S20 [Acidimicrobiales bacterium]